MGPLKGPKKRAQKLWVPSEGHKKKIFGMKGQKKWAGTKMTLKVWLFFQDYHKGVLGFARHPNKFWHFAQFGCFPNWAQLIWTNFFRAHDLSPRQCGPKSPAQPYVMGGGRKKNGPLGPKSGPQPYDMGEKKKSWF